MKAKNIRRTAVLALCAAMLSASLQTAAVSAPALPADESATAGALSAINIFRGDGTSFNLDGIPDRVQAAIMVVRMRGEEQMALDAYQRGEITNPFTDVTEDWAAPYVAWLYDRGITLGIGGGQFGRGTCSPAEYATFMLRALGYADTGEVTDFSWENAVSFAKEKGIYLDAFDRDTFDRGTMANITYLTLAADVKETDKSLLLTLTESGAVDQLAAKELLTAFGEIAPEAPADHIDLHGAPLNILMHGTGVRSFLGDAAGDTVDAAMYARRVKIEDGLNTVLETTVMEGDDFSRWIRATVMAYDPTYDFEIGGLTDTVQISAMGMLEDIGGLAGVDLSGEGWNQSINAGLSVAGRQYAAVGEMILPRAAQSVLYYNPMTVETLGLTDPYQLVMEGKWTLDAFAEMASAYAASGASGSFVLADSYLPHKLYNSAGQSVVSRDDENLPAFAIDTDFVSALMYRISEIPGILYTESVGASAPAQALAEGGAVFAADTLTAIDTYLGGDSGFALVPMPKYNEAQESYVAPSDFRAMQVLSVPVIFQKEELGAVLEYMNDASADVRAAYLTRYGQSSHNAEMIDLILDAGMVDLVPVSGTLAEVLGKLNTSPTDAAMLIAQVQAPIAKQVEKLNAAFKDMQ